MKKAAKLLIWIIIIAGAVTLAEFFFLQKTKQPAPQPQKNISQPPQAEPVAAKNTDVPENNAANNADTASVPDSAPIDPPPAKFILDMPFYSQAPLGKWDAVHEETCEEASVLNAGLYLLNKKLTPTQFDKELKNVIDIENKLFGDFKDTTITQAKQFSDQYFGGKISSKIIDNPTIEDIEAEVAAGHPVIVPLSGRDIGNPNFTPPGPVYHMVVIKGYDSQNFITNDVGTHKGASYVYKKDVIMKNMHDWNIKNIHLGTKRILVLSKS